MAWLGRSVAERLLEKVEVGEGDCLLWTGATDGSGYGRLYYDHAIPHAHRLAYEIFVGPIPEGLTLDHLCRVRRCVNPAHLEPVTMRENILRGVSVVAQNASKTTCPKGHPYDATETYRESRSGRLVTARRCRRCANANRRLRIERAA